MPRALAAGAAAVAVVVVLAGPGAYSLVTAATPHSGAIPTAGPDGSGMRMAGAHGGGGQAPHPGTAGVPNGTAQPPMGAQPGTGTPGTGTGRPGAGGTGTSGGGTGPGRGGIAQGGSTLGQGAPGTGQGAGQAGGRGGFSGLLGAATPAPAVVELLKNDASTYTWTAAAIGSNNAAGYQLATGDAVMPVGGYNGTDPSPTLEQYQQLVADGQIHWFIAGGMMGGASASGSDQSQEISDWVAATFSPVTVNGVTLHDLSTAS
jgi:hypothetical protein